MANVQLNGKQYTQADLKSLVEKLPQDGIFEVSYIAPEESANTEVRQELGRKYLGWNAEYE